MSNNIRSIVESAVPTHLRRDAGPVVNDVVNALEQALAQSLNTLQVSARRAGVSQRDFDEALISAGLKERPAPAPVAAPAPAVDASAAAAISRLEATVNSLRAAAERHGIRLS